MTNSELPHRSILYMPGSNPRALDKGRTLEVDALILDLEDAVSPEEKGRAREQVVSTLAEGGFGHRRLIIRINGLDTPWGEEDLAAAIEAKPDAILLPKVDTSEILTSVAARLESSDPVRLWAMMETPLGILNAAEIAPSTPRLEAFVMGTNDLAKDLSTRFRPDRAPLMTGLGLCLLAARAHGLLCIDGVFNAFKDVEGLAAECEAGRDLGFDGKTLIHPAQVACANRIFAPSAKEIHEAREIVEAFEKAEALGQGVAVLNGRIVENLHAETAKRTLTKAAAITRQAEAILSEGAR